MTDPAASPDRISDRTPTDASGSDSADWTDQVTALIVDTIDKVRSHTTGPILEVSKGMVYAIVAIVLATPVLVLSVIGFVRLVTIWVPVWATYLGLGMIFVVVGVVLWSKRGRVPT